MTWLVCLVFGLVITRSFDANFVVDDNRHVVTDNRRVVVDNLRAAPLSGLLISRQAPPWASGAAVVVDVVVVVGAISVDVVARYRCQVYIAFNLRC